MTRIVEGLRAAEIPDRAKVAPPPPLEARAEPASPAKPQKRQFGSEYRGLYLELKSFPARQIGDQVIPARTVKVRFADGVLKLDPSNPDDAEKIALIEAHQNYGTNMLYDRAERLEREAQEKATQLADIVQAGLADPKVRAALRERAGAGLLDMLTSDEPKPGKTA